MDTNDAHLCRNCGDRFDRHRSADGRCPGGPAFPRWPKSVRDEVKAGALWDKRIAAFWAKRQTAFLPR